jgi:hypothetical protein
MTLNLISFTMTALGIIKERHSVQKTPSVTTHCSQCNYSARHCYSYSECPYAECGCFVSHFYFYAECQAFIVMLNVIILDVIIFLTFLLLC